MAALVVEDEGENTGLTFNLERRPDGAVYPVVLARMIKGSSVRTCRICAAESRAIAHFLLAAADQIDRDEAKGEKS